MSLRHHCITAGRYFKDIQYISVAVIVLGAFTAWSWLLWLLVHARICTCSMFTCIRLSGLLHTSYGTLACATGASPATATPTLTPIPRLLGPSAPDTIDAATQKRLDKKQRHAELAQRRAK